jgi:hypothetical protein
MAMEHRSDPGRIKNETTDLQRDIAAKGGPALGLGDPENRRTDSPVSPDSQARSASQSADNDMDKQTNVQHNAQNDAEEAQSDGNLSFPEGK